MVPNWVQKSLDNATEKELKIYKEEWLGECMSLCMTSSIAKFEARGITVGTGMPTELVEHPFLGLMLNWSRCTHLVMIYKTRSTTLK